MVLQECSLQRTRAAHLPWFVVYTMMGMAEMCGQRVLCTRNGSLKVRCSLPCRGVMNSSLLEVQQAPQQMCGALAQATCSRLCSFDSNLKGRAMTCKQQATRLDLQAYAGVSLLGVAALYWTNLSLHTLPYTVKIVVKSCRVLPVMLLSVPLQRCRYSQRQYAAAVAMVAGVLLFFVADWHRMPQQGAPSGHGRQWDGLALLGAALLLDAPMANLEESCFFREVPPAPRVEVMTYLSAFGCVYSLAALLASGALTLRSSFWVPRVPRMVRMLW
jgi:UAA transporter family